MTGTTKTAVIILTIKMYRTSQQHTEN